MTNKDEVTMLLINLRQPRKYKRKHKIFNEYSTNIFCFLVPAFDGTCCTSEAWDMTLILRPTQLHQRPFEDCN